MHEIFSRPLRVFRNSCFLHFFSFIQVVFFVFSQYVVFFTKATLFALSLPLSTSHRHIHRIFFYLDRIFTNFSIIITPLLMMHFATPHLKCHISKTLLLYFFLSMSNNYVFINFISPRFPRHSHFSHSPFSIYIG